MQQHYVEVMKFTTVMFHILFNDDPTEDDINDSIDASDNISTARSDQNIRYLPNRF